MILKEIDVKTFEDYAKKSPYRTFMQTISVGKLRELNGWKSYYLGLYDDSKIVGATLLVGKKRHFNSYEFYAPRGPLVDYTNEEVVINFFKQLREFVKKHHGYILRIDPYVTYKERDGKGKIVPDGYDNTNIVKTILKSGFIRVPYDDREQVTFMYAMDVKDKTEDEILKNMKSNTRNLIRKNIKNGIEIVELQKNQLDEFYRIMQSTGSRKGFDIRSVDYYKNMYDLFSENKEIKYLITRLDLSKYIKMLENEKTANVNKMKKLSDNINNDGKRKALEEAISGLDKKINLAKEEQDKYGNIITLSGSMFILTKPEVVYLSSGNYEEFLSYNSQYLIQWEMIKYAINNGYDRYNFYGIPNTFNDKNDKDYGIYEFKTGFNGYVEELIGEFEMKISAVYYLIKLIHKIRK